MRETPVKLIWNAYKLKTYQRRHELRDISDNNSKRAGIFDTQNKKIMISALVVKWLISKDKKV